MKYKFLIILIFAAFFFGSFNLKLVSAQPSDINEIPDEIPTDIPDEANNIDISRNSTETVEAMNIDDVKKDQFIKGAMVGGGFGVIAGGLVVWFLKETFF